MMLRNLILASVLASCSGIVSAESWGDVLAAKSVNCKTVPDSFTLSHGAIAIFCIAGFLYVSACLVGGYDWFFDKPKADQLLSNGFGYLPEDDTGRSFLMEDQFGTTIGQERRYSEA